MIHIWTEEKSQLSVECLEAKVNVKINIEKKCDDFLKEIEINKELLEKIHKSEKY